MDFFGVLFVKFTTAPNWIHIERPLKEFTIPVGELCDNTQSLKRLWNENTLRGGNVMTSSWEPFRTTETLGGHNRGLVQTISLCTMLEQSIFTFVWPQSSWDFAWNVTFNCHWNVSINVETITVQWISCVFVLNLFIALIFYDPPGAKMILVQNRIISSNRV